MYILGIIIFILVLLFFIGVYRAIKINTLKAERKRLEKSGGDEKRIEVITREIKNLSYGKQS